MPHVNRHKINKKIQVFLTAVLLLAGIFIIHDITQAESKLQVGNTSLILGATDNLIFGNISPSSSATSSLLLLQNNSSNVFRVDPSGNLIANGTITAGGFSGSYTGTIGAPNVSAGAFGANTGGGNYSFPGNVGIGVTNPANKLAVSGDVFIDGAVGDTTLDGFKIDMNRAEANYLTATNALGYFYFRVAGGNNAMKLATNSDAIFYGNVGIDY